MKRTMLFGQKDIFAIECIYFSEDRTTQLSMFVNSKNVTAFEMDGRMTTTRWDLEGLALWLREFIDSMQEDPYPVEVEGEYAAEKDCNAREYDTDDMELFDAYYDKLDEWNLRHRWHPAGNGAILADIYFEQVDGKVQISWNNEDNDEDVKFAELRGGATVNKVYFQNAVDAFLQNYADHWFPIT